MFRIDSLIIIICTIRYLSMLMTFHYAYPNSMRNNKVPCRLLLPYERYQRGEEAKMRLTHGRRTKSVSEESDIKEEPSDTYPSETPPPVEVISATTPPLQPIMSAATVNSANSVNAMLRDAPVAFSTYLMRASVRIIYTVSLALADFPLE